MTMLARGDGIGNGSSATLPCNGTLRFRVSRAPRRGEHGVIP